MEGLVLGQIWWDIHSCDNSAIVLTHLNASKHQTAMFAYNKSINQSNESCLHYIASSYPFIPCGSSKSVLCFFTGLHRVLQELFSWVYTHHHLDKSAWSDDSWFLLWHSDGIVKFFCKQHDSMDPCWLVSMAQAAAGGIIVLEIFFDRL